MNDGLLGNTKYEKPVWNLHDALGLPTWLELALDQRTRYESMDGQFRAGTKGGDQQIALQTDLWLASANDCWGLANCTGNNLIMLPTATSGSYVGDLFGLTARYDFNSSLNFETGWYRLFKGEFAKTGNAAPAAQNVDYLYVQSQLRF